jgi:hypothetical protein
MLSHRTASVKVRKEDLESMFDIPVIKWRTLKENSDGSLTVSFKNKEVLKLDDEGGWLENFEFKE